MIVIVLGTRPEAIKLGPVVLEFRRRHMDDDLLLVNTGQHRDLLHPVLELFGIEPDVDLGLSSHGLHLTEVLARTLTGLQAVVQDVTAGGTPIRCVMAQGDTHAVLAAALVAQLNRIPFAHVEAGLRSHHFGEPFPEEYNRRVASLNARIHFAPTPSARTNLLREGVEASKILLTGNTGVDAARLIAAQVRQDPLSRELRDWIAGGDVVLVTCHRRENHGERMHRVLHAVCCLADNYPQLHFLWVLHPNSAAMLQAPNARDLPPNARFVPPLDYRAMLALYQTCRLVITDSGGVQEDAVEFGLPVLVTRNVTERSEGAELGWAELTGTDPQRIMHAFHRKIHGALPCQDNPYGDGKAAKRIVTWCVEHLVAGCRDLRTSVVSQPLSQSLSEGKAWGISLASGLSSECV